MSTNGVDCSGFVSLVWRLNGVILSRDADQQIAQAKQLDVLCVEDIPAGSLVAFGQKNEAGVNVVRHIGIALEMVTLFIHWGTCAFNRCLRIRRSTARTLQSVSWVLTRLT